MAKKPKHPEGLIELSIEEGVCPECRVKHSVLLLDVTASKEHLLDLSGRLKKTLDEWLTANGIMIADGVGPDGCRYDSKPN